MFAARMKTPNDGIQNPHKNISFQTNKTCRTIKLNKYFNINEIKIKFYEEKLRKISKECPGLPPWLDPLGGPCAQEKNFRVQSKEPSLSSFLLTNNR